MNLSAELELGDPDCYALCILEFSNHGSHHALDVDVSLDDERIHCAVGWLEADVIGLAVKAFECCVLIVEKSDDDVSVFW